MRATEAGYVYHVLNRANARLPLFKTPDDYRAMESVLEEAVARTSTRLLAYCLMPNHWHLVVWPQTDGELSAFVGWLTLTHTQRWHACRQSIGTGHLYQGRFKSFPVQGDQHFLNLCRYVERNPRRAKLVRRAEQWRYGSLYRWHAGTAAEKALLSPWPLSRRPGWVDYVNASQTVAELARLRLSIERSRPYGDADWIEKTAARLGLETTLRPRGRPRME